MKKLGRYRLVAELARGGMGIIHLAEARGPGGFEKLVVLKELKHELSDDPVYTSMFLDEARLAARLTHRHIVQTNEVGCEGGRYFMALELLEGGSLHQIRTKLGLRGVPMNLALRVLVAVLDALHHAHELCDAAGRSLEIVHRDVSPQNVFLTFDGEVKLIDFGVAKSADRRAQTKVGIVKGSVPYMSPDHVDGSAIDRRADVFAVGVLLHELLSGARLWGGADDMTILRRLIRRDVPAFPCAVEIPAALRSVLASAMAPRRADRFASAAAMRGALAGHLAAVDPGGSLDDLGVWLGHQLKDERAAFREIVRRGRQTAPVSHAHVWLPSSELKTRVSGPPRRAAPALPLPPEGRSTSRLRIAGTGALFAAALGLAALGGLAPSSLGDGAPLHAARSPRTVSDPLEVGVVTSPSLEEAHAAPGAPEAAATAPVLAARAGAAQVPAEVLHEVVPPNPYDPVE